MRVSILIILVSLFSSQVLGEEFLVSINKKQEDKYANRWTLASWFEDQRKMRLQDMWLAGNTREDIYEFYIGSSNFFGTHNSSVSSEIGQNMSEASLALYASIVGLQFDYFDRANSESVGWSSQFKLRLFGSSMQNTSLFLGYGKKTSKIGANEYSNDMYSVQATLYFTKNFGLLADHQSILASNSNGTEFLETITEYQLFIDFSVLRLFYSVVDMDQSIGTTSVEIQGQKAGFKLFF